MSCSELSSQSEELFEPRHLKSKAKLYHRWTLEENAKYIAFLQLAKEDFEHEYTRRIKKVFKRLSEFMGSKSESQCKSHHQKMLKQYESVDRVIAEIDRKVQTEANTQAASRKQEARFQRECTRRIRKVFRKLAEFMRSHNPEKIQKRQMFILRVFSELSKAIQLHSRNCELQDSEGQLQMENIENLFGQGDFDEAIFDVLDF